MKKVIKVAYLFFYNFFYKKIGSDKTTSKEFSISILILLNLIFIYLLINELSIVYFNFNFLKNSNIWILLLTGVVFYFILYKVINYSLKKE